MYTYQILLVTQMRDYALAAGNSHAANVYQIEIDSLIRELYDYKLTD